MDVLTLENKRDFPMTTNVLKFMQDAYSALEKIAAIGGENIIVSGCTVTGSSVSDGYMFLKGILMPFKAGTIATNVKIVKTVSQVTVDTGTREQTSYYAEFGTSTDPTMNVPWADIEAIPTNSELRAELDVLQVELGDFVTAIRAYEGSFDALDEWIYAVNYLFSKVSNLETDVDTLNNRALPTLSVKTNAGYTSAIDAAIGAGMSVDAKTIIIIATNTSRFYRLPSPLLDPTVNYYNGWEVTLKAHKDNTETVSINNASTDMAIAQNLGARDARRYVYYDGLWHMVSSLDV